MPVNVFQQKKEGMHFCIYKRVQNEENVKANQRATILRDLLGFLQKIKLTSFFSLVNILTISPSIS